MGNKEGCLIIYRDDQLKKNLSCLCLEDGEPDVTGKLLYWGYAEPKLKAFFDGHNKVCRQLKSKISRTEFLSPSEFGACPVGWIYKYEDGQWYITENYKEYRPLKSVLKNEPDSREISKYLTTNYLPAKEQIEELKKLSDSPLLECENMAEVDIEIPDETLSLLESLSEEFGCSIEELVRYLLLSYVSDLFVGEGEEIQDIPKENIGCIITKTKKGETDAD